MTRKNFYREKNFSSIKSIYFFLLFYYYICVSNFLYESRLYNVSLYTLYLERFLREDKRRKEVSTVKGFNLLVGYSEMFFSSLKITWIFQRSLERFLNCWLKKKEIFFALFSILFLTFTFQSCSQILCRSILKSLANWMADTCTEKRKKNVKRDKKKWTQESKKERDLWKFIYIYERL